MKKTSCVLLLICVVLGLALSAAESIDDNKSTKEKRMKITIGEKAYTATLEDNEAANAFKEMLPLNLKMSDLNDNEKVIRLSDRLPTNDSNPGKIQTGDLMSWSSTSLVLFYKSFPTPYRYTKLGRIDNPQGLSKAVGSGDVTIKFELQ